MKKFLSLLLVFSMFSAQAAVEPQVIKQVIDELHYSLTVEWDQKNEAYKKEALAKFSRQLDQLESEGMQSIDVYKVVLNDIKDERLKSTIVENLNLYSLNLLTKEAAIKQIIDQMEKTYSNGASWGGEVAIGVSLFIVATVLLVRAMIQSKKCSQDPSLNVCEWVQQCNYHDDGSDNYCYDIQSCGCKY